MISERALVARYFHRFTFGPKPGEYVTALQNGAPSSLNQILTNSPISKISPPVFETLGPRPKPGISQVEWTLKMRSQRRELSLWWLDQMASVDNSFQEKLIWFWHGHFATSLSKVDYANAMLIQNNIFRAHVLGNFRDLAREIIMDGALQYWLDNQTNTVKAPNENLAREVMELFTLGVNRYSEDDIKEAAKALTGYGIDRESGRVTFQANKHDRSIHMILGKSENFDAISLVDHLVSKDDCVLFIAERLWYRFVNDVKPMPDSRILQAFANREIFPLIKSIAEHSEIQSESNAYIKPPLEWFISACRALNVLPSQIAKPDLLLNYLDKLSQRPFYPPNVGGWPSGEIWLTAANAQYRIELAQLIVKFGDLSPIANARPVNRHLAIADLLGVGEWSSRTKSALITNRSNPELSVIAALCAPEYLVSI